MHVVSQKMNVEESEGRALGGNSGGASSSGMGRGARGRQGGIMESQKLKETLFLKGTMSKSPVM